MISVSLWLLLNLIKNFDLLLLLFLGPIALVVGRRKVTLHEFHVLGQFYSSKHIDTQAALIFG